MTHPPPVCDTELLVTLWPSFPHFPRFATDPRLSGIRLNSAMIGVPDLKKEFALLEEYRPTVPLYFDIKGKQLRIQEVNLLKSKSGMPDLELVLNHPIAVETPSLVLFKAGSDSASLRELRDGGKRLVFDGGPRYMVAPGESLCVRHPSLEVLGPTFTDVELEKIRLVKEFGFTRWFLSYVESQREVDEFLELVGKDTEVWLKIENLPGLRYVSEEFVKRPNLTLVMARGDLYVEVDRPHDILGAHRLLIEKDPEACAASRILLSAMGNANLTVNNIRGLAKSARKGQVDAARIIALIEEGERDPTPSCADFSELAWLADIGYRRVMLCDELCLKGKLLGRAVNAFGQFRDAYRGIGEPS
ncbi:MAG: hypothetical protein A3C93_03945 [Candidatus Lloydbacteria bacterium RIFCSPHIGHO2_02_FULL_54_17]|uniref:Pyruvate kinase barrel domain-containing protein n=1 Tax=Candidatus Lloydbacteria bacterium RIFCSPHIGHO2_02_FULL_54_17 TaxID=1798664 RepID=A0A1G2DF39_9BACT|nr:MAG: hypothetical protein A2762_03470 [Candidatus Lloydbacteria bacterium RIFCSPHIGHO2_01_FULL_54_11]OGZ12264.1 MAG: hypothetical protein A3C93_03945 [Candidatus Lloydbacteria bacterium RIFCSPHIGHO2_02_FULL_54_17]OGZ13967.1 MAG: hypothetical protein A2948_00595 [Candidatus Lloydbacteria bacterium RIFCSPLOWO2_01_FULL_54_18]